MREPRSTLLGIATCSACLLTLCGAFTVHANLLGNADFENPVGTGMDTNWALLGGNEQQIWWAGETAGSTGISFNTWVIGGSGGFWQELSLDHDATYYYRVRNSRDEFVTNVTYRVDFEYFESDHTAAGVWQQVLPLPASPFSWTSQVAAVSTHATNATYLRVLTHYFNATNDGPTRATKWDNATLYDRNAYYRSHEVVEEFSYDEHVSMTNMLDGKDRGGGFTNRWIEGTAGSFTIVDGSLSQVSGYRTHRGNKVMVDPPAADTNLAYRPFAPVMTGALYAAFIMNYEQSEAGDGSDQQFVGLSFLSNTTELAFFGEVAGAAASHGIASYGGSDKASAFALNPGPGNEYIIFAKYDFGTTQLYSRAYEVGGTIPSTEPEWGVTGSVPAGRITMINGIRLSAGSGQGTPGECYFDEIYLSRTWIGLSPDDRPQATQLDVNGGNPVTDGQVSDGTFEVVMAFTNRTGTESTNVLYGFFQPQFALFNNAGFQILTGETFESYSYLDSGRDLVATDLTHSTAAPQRVDTGTYVLGWSAVSSNRFSSLNHTLLVSGTTTSFEVIDDDTNAPVVTSIVLNAGIQLTDANIRNGIWPLEMHFEDISGVYTGVGPDGPTWSPNYSLINSIGETVAVEIGWDTLATVDGTNFLATDSATPAVLYSNVSLGTYSVTWSAQDADNDRDFDRMNEIHSTNVEGDSNMFYVIDDDTTAPIPPTNLVLTPSTWTNVNFFAVTWSAAADSESGISEYRGSTNTMTPTLLTDGFTLPGITTTNALPYTITNADFELGTDGLLVPGTVTNGWISYGSGGARARWTSTEKQNGALGIIHSVDAGGGGLRDTLVAQDVSIFNSNDQQVVVSFSGHFKGDMSVAGAGGPPAAFLKVEFLDSNGVRIAMATVDNQYNTDHNGAPLSGVNIATWTNVTISTSSTNPAPANTESVRFLTGVAQNGRDVNLVGYWDNLSATISLISFGGSSGITLTNAVEGIRTNWVFAVDDDNDRPDDRLMSRVTNFVTRYDLTAPLQVVITNAGPGPDPTTDALIGWDPLPDGGGIDLSPWWTYVVYYTDEARDPTNTDPFVSLDTGHTSLGTNTSTGVTLSNLTFGTTYRLTVTARDRAGNESVLGAPATISLSAFSVTQGVVAAVSGEPVGANLAWRASTNSAGDVNKVYDLIYVDALNYSDSLTNQWQLLETVTESFVVDTGSTTRTPPTSLVNTMRFYRAALSGKWALTNLPDPLASREIYGAKNVVLSNGQNFISMFVVPDSNSVALVLGTNMLPAGPVMGSSTIVSWYDPVSTNAAATNVIWLADSGHWIWEQGGSGNADGKPLPLDQGFNVEIPTNGPGPIKLLLIGRVPTNALACPIYPSAAHNIVSYAAPRFCTLSELDIENSGFTGGTSRRQSDEVRILARGAGAFGSPRLRCWYDIGTGTWRRWSDGGSAMNEIVEPDEAIIIFTRKSNSTFVWTNPLYYSEPGIHMNP